MILLNCGSNKFLNDERKTIPDHWEKMNARVKFLMIIKINVEIFLLVNLRIVKFFFGGE